MSDLLQRSVGAHVARRTELPDQLPLALIDANQLELAVLNLAINARDAMPEGGVLTIAVDHLRAALASEATVADYVRVIVTDTGYGMAVADLARAAVGTEYHCVGNACVSACRSTWSPSY